jgi:hypothetical protein
VERGRNATVEASLGGHGLEGVKVEGVAKKEIWIVAF